MASIVESTPGPSKGAEGASLSTVLAGVTPRPPITSRRRVSHPLAQAYVPSPAASETGSAAAYENDDRMSMVSTTSSQDLTTNRRANASFDPAMGFGVGATGHGVGRFNAGKLNNYLHTLNRRLQEENEVLLERLKTFEEKQELSVSPNASGSSRRLSRGSLDGRRLSAGTSLNDVKEDPTAEVWLEEKAELESLIESLKEEVANCMAEKEDIENALENERHERERDKERWKERMAEVEAGVSELVGQLETKLEVAEKKASEVAAESGENLKEAMYEIEELHVKLNLVNGRAKKAEQALESDKDLGGALNEANEKVVQLASELQELKTYAEQLEENAETVVGRLEILEAEVTEKQKTIQKLQADDREAKQQILQLEDECVKAQDVNVQMGEALEEVEKKKLQETEEIVGLKSEIAALEREKQRVMVNASQSISRSLEPAGPTEEDIEALEMELGSAHKEITRLTGLLAQSPARRAMEKAKDTRIELLEKEREDLLERNKALRMTMNEMATPHKVMKTSNISPIHRQVLSMSIRAPRTPGPPLRDVGI
jgi:chromosome segregation ATPase